MRKLIFFLMCIFTVLTSSAKVKQINTPYWQRTQNMDLRSLTLSDTATVLSFKIVHPDGWNLSSGCRLIAEGKTLKARGARRYRMTKNGAVPAEFSFDKLVKDSDEELAKNPYPVDSLVVCFEPLPRGTQTFDFSENDDPNGWKIYGIRTVGKPYPFIFKESKTKNTTDVLPPYEPKAALAVLKGHIYGYDNSRKMDYGYYSYQNPLTQGFDIKISIDSTGDYRAQTMAYFPIHPYITLLGQTFKTILVPGETTTLDLDIITLTGRNIEANRIYCKPQIKSKGYNLSGRFAPLLQALREQTQHYTRIDSMKLDTAITLADYTARLWRTYQEDMAALAKKNDYSPMQRDFMRLVHEYTYATKRIDYANYIFGTYYYKTRNDSIADIEKTKAKARLTLSDPHAQELMLLKDMRSAYLIDDTSLMPYMEANGLGGNEVYRWMAGLKKAQELASRISALQPVTDNAEWDSIMPYYRPTLKQMNDTTLSILARQKASQKSDVHICETTALTSADILSEIVSKYPGKVVLVDCWATWCVPCRRGIEAMKPMEKELEGKDFVPVFLTDGSSPIKTWVEMTNTMPGEHYRLTNEQWKKLPSMNGIPRYWLFGKDGKKLMDQTGWGDELLETFRTNINKALQ